MDSRRAAASSYDRFMRWLRGKPGWEFVSPRDLLVRHIQAEDHCVVLDLVQEYVGQLALKRKSTKQKAYSTIRSFFAHNRCALFRGLRSWRLLRQEYGAVSGMYIEMWEFDSLAELEMNTDRIFADEGMRKTGVGESH